MAPRPQPTIRQRRFGAELRRLREGAGLTAPMAAELLGTDRTVISNVEAGRFGISEERLRRLVSIYECDDEALIEALAAMTGGRKPGWWDEYRGKIPPGFLDVSEIENAATALWTVQTAHLPGLFQTEAHARALFDLALPALPRLEIELRVAHRLARQAVVAPEGGTPYRGLIHETALRIPVGGRAVAKEQLVHLLAAGDRSNVTLRVIPFAAGEFPMMGESLLYASGETSRLDTVHMDSPAGAVFIDSPTQLANFRRRMEVIEKVALPEAGSRTLIRRIEREL